MERVMDKGRCSILTNLICKNLQKSDDPGGKSIDQERVKQGGKLSWRFARFVRSAGCTVVYVITCNHIPATTSVSLLCIPLEGPIVAPWQHYWYESLSVVVPRRRLKQLVSKIEQPTQQIQM